MKLALTSIIAAAALSTSALAMTPSLSIDPAAEARGATGFITTGETQSVSIDEYVSNGRDAEQFASETTDVTVFENTTVETNPAAYY